MDSVLDIFSQSLGSAYLSSEIMANQADWDSFFAEEPALALAERVIEKYMAARISLLNREGDGSVHYTTRAQERAILRAVVASLAEQRDRSGRNFGPADIHGGLDLESLAGLARKVDLDARSFSTGVRLAIQDAIESYSVDWDLAIRAERQSQSLHESHAVTLLLMRQITRLIFPWGWGREAALSGSDQAELESLLDHQLGILSRICSNSLPDVQVDGGLKIPGIGRVGGWRGEASAREASQHMSDEMILACRQLLRLLHPAPNVQRCSRREVSNSIQNVLSTLYGAPYEIVAKNNFRVMLSILEGSGGRDGSADRFRLGDGRAFNASQRTE
jgi:hypothetical protein